MKVLSLLLLVGLWESRFREGELRKASRIM